MQNEEAIAEFSSEIRRRFVKGFLDVLILQMVQAESTWGYDMIKKTENRFKTKLRHGALYPALSRLESLDFLKSRTHLHKGRPRKVYSITKRGRLFLHAYYNFFRKQLPTDPIL